jgi:hypothetical protein
MRRWGREFVRVGSVWMGVVNCSNWRFDWTRMGVSITEFHLVLPGFTESVKSQCMSVNQQQYP